MAPGSDLEMVGRLVLATVLGFVIGLERAFAGQPAGDRTHALVSLGAATFALVSLTAFPGGDSARIAAGVVTGLGFLGAGMILRREGAEIQGLTTAAGIWGVGGLGLSIGAGAYRLGLAVAALIWLVLVMERVFKIDDRLAARRQRERDR